jgi:uncharacterized protein YcbK (DUF882 family)
MRPLGLRARWILASAVVALATVVGGARAWRGAPLADRPTAESTIAAAPAPATDSLAAPASEEPPASRPLLGDSLLGRSGRLRVLLVRERALAELTHPSDSVAPGTYAVPGGIAGKPFMLLALRPFARKVGPMVGRYHVGYWPGEWRSARSRSATLPVGFVEVTPENQDTELSEHFRLRDFITHDQPDVWPKYVVLRVALLDKLELVLQDLRRHGVSTSRVVVLSGFRTPAYNSALGDASGRARESRHQYGDAADIIIDADGDGRMDDLNGDGRIDARDVRVIERAVERVERVHPDLVGGLGLYAAMGPRGPFAHIDVRGEIARWTGGPGARPRAPGDNTRAVPVGRCQASGPSAVLCSRLGQARR